MKKALFLIACIIVVGNLWSYLSDNFVVGCYSNLKPWNTSVNSVMLDKMQAAHYNVSIWENTETTADVSLTDALLLDHYNHGLDSYLVDYFSNYNTSGDLTSAGAHTISTGNYWKFEAEFYNNTGYTADIESNNRYFHKFAPYQGRVGYKPINEDVWRCDSLPAGIALGGLQYRFHDPYGTDNIGEEFRFTLWDNANQIGHKYLSWDSLYIKVKYKVDDNASGNLEAMTFRCNFAPDGSNAGFVDLRNNKYPSHLGQELIYTFDQLRSITYTDPISGSDYRTITFSVSMLDLLNAGFINDRYWTCSLKRIDPYIYWCGNGGVNLDYVEIFDKLSNTLRLQSDTAKNWLISRIDDYNANLQYAKSFYTLDEPQQPQFDTYQRLKSILSSSLHELNLLYNIKSYATVNWSGGRRVKPDNKRFSLPELLSDPQNQYNPSELMVDYYPLSPTVKWNGSNQNATDQIQWNLDYKTLHFYNNLKRKTRDLNIPFYVVPPSTGQWNRTQNYWDGYLLPTANMMKCLKYLPLCYGVDGILDWELYSKDPVRDVSDTDVYHFYEPGSLNDAGGPLFWVSPLQYSNGVLSESPQYQSIVTANSKLHDYGYLLKSLLWDKAAYIDASGLKLQNDIYGQESYYESNPTPGNYLSSLTAFDPYYNNNGSPYQGYIQVGLYHDSSRPYYMIVNRRTDFVETSASPEGKMTLLTPTQMKTPYGTNGHASGFYSAPAQKVRFVPSQYAYSSLGSSVALYDPYDSALYKLNGSNIDVLIEPGDGKLLQMVQTLPSTVTVSTTFPSIGYIQGNISITNNATVTFTTTSNVTVLSNTTITIESGCSLTINGKCTVLENSHIVVNPGGVLNINLGQTNQICSFSNSSDISVVYGTANISNTVLSFSGSAKVINNGGSLNISNSAFSFGTGYIKVFSSAYPDYEGTLNITSSTFDKNASVERWVGIRADDASEVNVQNSIISNALVGLKSENTNLYVHNTKFHIPTFLYNGNFYRTLGVEVTNTATGKILQISADDSTYGFFGLDGTPGPLDMKTGLFVQGCNTKVRGVSFHNLHYGINLIAAFAANDSISYCQFNDCVTGIYTLAGYHSGTISHCRFTQTASDNQMIGISMEVSAPAVKNCDFYNLKGSGILTIQSVYINQDGVYQCNFYNCGSIVNNEPRGAGLESYYATNLVTGSTFNQNITGILNHAQSNLNLTHEANNVFNNKYYNIKFSESHPYQAWIQLYKGHNDFYHFRDPQTSLMNYDFCFDTNYFQDYQLDIIDADGNWFQDNTVRVYPESLAYYVEVDNFDPFPNSTGFIGEGRFFTALNFEFNQQFTEAIDLYKEILNNPLPEEKPFLGNCSDGIFRISLHENYPVNQSISYFDEKVLQYAVTEPYLSKLLQAYLLKELIIGKDFQEAIDIIQPRIDNPVSEIDSLRAVLDIELILQLAALEETKRPLTVSCPQYRYSDIQTFTKKHNEHWKMMLDLLNKGETEEIPVPTIATLYQNYPNPFNPSTTISFAIPKDSPVAINIYNIKGQLVRKLCQTNMNKGYHKIVWDGKDEKGQEAGSGLYLIHMGTDGKAAIKKAMLLK